MIVEDDPEIRNFIKLYLRNDGYETVEVDQGDLVLEIFKNKNLIWSSLIFYYQGLTGLKYVVKSEKFLSYRLLF